MNAVNEITNLEEINTEEKKITLFAEMFVQTTNQWHI